jgi:hypothetical protein
MEKWYEVLRLKNYNSKDNISIHYLQNLDLIKNSESKDYLWKYREMSSLPIFDATAMAIEYLKESNEMFNAKLHEGKQILHDFGDIESIYQNYMWSLVFGVDMMIANLQKSEQPLNKYNVTFNTDSELQSNIVVLSTSEAKAIQGVKYILENKGIAYKNNLLATQISF